MIVDIMRAWPDAQTKRQTWSMDKDDLVFRKSRVLEMADSGENRRPDEPTWNGERASFSSSARMNAWVYLQLTRRVLYCLA